MLLKMNFYIIKRKKKEELFGFNTNILHKMKFADIYIYIILFIKLMIIYSTKYFIKFYYNKDF